MSISNRKHMILILMGITLIVVGYYFVHSVYPQISIVGGGVGAPMVVNNPNLKVETVFKGLRPPTSMAFLGPNDILVLEKDDWHRYRGLSMVRCYHSLCFKFLLLQKAKEVC